MRRYTRTELIQKAGFEIHYCSYFFFLLFPPVLIARTFGRLFSKKETDDLKHTNRLIDKCLQKILSLETSLMPHVSFPFGVSLIAVAQHTPDQ